MLLGALFWTPPVVCFAVAVAALALAVVVVAAARLLRFVALCVVWPPLFTLATHVHLLVWRVRHQAPGHQPAHAAAFASVCRELRAMVLLRLARAHRGRVVDASSDARPVLLVHGAFADGSTLAPLRAALANRGRRTVVVELGAPLQGQARYAARVAEALERASQDSVDGRVDVVCHSMGGVALRLALWRRPSLRPRTGRVVTLGTPHQGTALVRGWLRFLPLPEAIALRRGSRFLRALPPLTTLLSPADVTTVTADFDGVVYPASAAQAPGARHVAIPALGHGGLLVSRRARRAVWAALSA